MSKRKPPPRKKPKPPPAPSGPPRWLPAVALLGVVAIAVVIFVLTRPGPAPPPPKHLDLAAQLAQDRTGELDRVGAGTATAARYKRVSEPALTADGKPQVLYIGAEYCPYCAGERWALIVALSRFGSFSRVQPITSSEGNLATFTFHGSSYTSSYVAFRPVEIADGSGKPLDTPSAAESALEQKYASGIPFVDFGNRMVFDGATYDVGVLQGLTWQQILTQLQQPGSDASQGIFGSANLITAGICELTGQEPAAVCSDPVIQNLAHRLPAS